MSAIGSVFRCAFRTRTDNLFCRPYKSLLQKIQARANSYRSPNCNGNLNYRFHKKSSHTEPCVIFRQFYFHPRCQSRKYSISSLKYTTQRVNFKTNFTDFKWIVRRRGSTSPVKDGLDRRVISGLFYLSAVAVLVGGICYAMVPLYRLYCQVSGTGSAIRDDYGNKLEEMERVEDRVLTIRFTSQTSDKLKWRFKPEQEEVKVAPGETALAFYKAENLTDKPIIGIATYNVLPFEAGKYFNKIQCFCFEEQMLNPNEEVDMPVFFYIDPEIMDDAKLSRYDEITLSYTFFESAEHNSPLPSPHQKVVPKI